MKRRVSRIIVIVILIIAAAAFGYYTQIFNSKVDMAVNYIDNFGELTSEQKLQDFNYMYEIFRDNFPFFEVKKRVYSYDWLGHKEEFEELIKSSENNSQFYTSLDKILRRLQNGHTHVLSPSSFEEYRRLYSTISSPWKQVLNNEAVIERNRYWTDIAGNDKSVVPLIFEYIEGNYIAARDIDGSSSRLYGVPEGSRLEGINGMTVDEYLETLLDTTFLQYDFKRSKLKKSYLAIYTEQNAVTVLTFIDPEGKIIKKAVESVAAANVKVAFNEQQSNINTEILDEGSIAYLKVNSLWREYLDVDKGEIYSFYEKVKDYPFLIIDIRGNGGGSDNYWEQNIVAPLIDEKLGTEFYQVIRPGKYIEPFVKHKWGKSYGFLKSTSELPENKTFPPELDDDFGYFKASERTVSPMNPVGFKGKIFLLVDEGVYSSSESFAAFAKATGWATLVGTTTGGDGIGFDPILFSLPNSGLIIRFTCDMGLNPDGTVNEESRTQPDIYVEKTLNDFIDLRKAVEAGLDVRDFKEMIKHDTMLKRVIEEINKGSS